MKKITDNSYFLPIIHATNCIEIFDSGTTMPMLIRGICTKTNKKSDYVVKYKGAQRMTIESSCRELLASFIANELGLLVPEPVLINISPEFIETLYGEEGFKVANNSLGLNFGCKYIKGYHPFVRGIKLTDNQLRNAEKIFVFDVFLSNVDRREGKPNMLTNDDDILIFDHELAFSFLNFIITNPTPWEFDNNDLNSIRIHYFYQYLRQVDKDFSIFVEEFKSLDKNFWTKAKTLIPNEWHTDQVGKIQKHLESLINHWQEFLQNLNKALS